jgi:predicted nuclease of predicted toxin-antitoxin system
MRNLSPRLVSILSAHWPESAHVESINMRGATDEAIWSFARDHGFTLVSKDDDFRSFALVRGAPPKVVWLQIGNAPSRKSPICYAPTFLCWRHSRTSRPKLSSACEAKKAHAYPGRLEITNRISSLSMPTSPMPDMTWIVGINDMEY